jgi:hypothetical protein
MSYEFFINQAILVVQNTQLSAVDILVNNALYDYVLDINVSSVDSRMNSLFTTRTYIENSLAPNLYNATLAPDNVALTAVLNGASAKLYSNHSGVVGSTAAYGSIPTNLEKAGQRLLEIVATKIFGNPRTTAAIVNDTTFTSTNGVNRPVDQIAKGFYDSMSAMQNDFFNQYVASDRIQVDQKDNLNNGDFNFVQNFNMQCTHLDIPMFLNGQIVNEANQAIPGAFASLLAGPNVGGTSLVAGKYNIPILLRIHD